MPETDDKLKPGDLARALTAVVPEGSAAALVDTSADAVERLAEWVSRDYTAMRAHAGYPWPEDRSHGEGLTAATLRALLAERDAMHVDLNRAYAERQALEDQCVALRDERDVLRVQNDAFWQTYDGMNVHQIFTGYTQARDARDAAVERAEAAEAQRDALLAVVRAARTCQMHGMHRIESDNRLAIDHLYDALDALPPEVREMVDHSD